MKGELELDGNIMTEFAALRPKTYRYLTDDNKNKKVFKERTLFKTLFKLNLKTKYSHITQRKIINYCDVTKENMHKHI